MIEFFYPLGSIDNFRHIKKLLMKKYGAKASFKNYLLFYLPFFDDFVRAYYINNKLFVIEPDGFGITDGVCIHTQLENEQLLRSIVADIETLGLQSDKN